MMADTAFNAEATIAEKVIDDSIVDAGALLEGRTLKPKALFKHDDTYGPDDIYVSEEDNETDRVEDLVDRPGDK